MTIEEKCRELRKWIKEQQSYWIKRANEAARDEFETTEVDAFARQGAFAAVQRMLDQLEISE